MTFELFVESQDKMLNSINIIGKSFSDLMALFFCNIEGDDDYYDVVAYNLAKDHRTQLEAMLGKLEGPRLRAAICGIGLTEFIASSELLQQYLSHQDFRVVAETIDALRRTHSADWPIVAESLHHLSPYVRGAALRFAKERLGQESLPILREALRDHEPIVRQNALDELEGLLSQANKDEITPFLQDPSEDVRCAAAYLIDSISS